MCCGKMLTSGRSGAKVAIHRSGFTGKNTTGEIWEDTRPLFYWNIDLTMPDWAKRRMLKEEQE